MSKTKENELQKSVYYTCLIMVPIRQKKLNDQIFLCWSGTDLLVQFDLATEYMRNEDKFNIQFLHTIFLLRVIWENSWAEFNLTRFDSKGIEKNIGLYQDKTILNWLFYDVQDFFN